MSAIESPAPAIAKYNATVKVLKETPSARVLQVILDFPKTRYRGGQYGSLGLASDADPTRLIKRAYSLSSPIVDFATGRLIDCDDSPFYEFYFNLVAGGEGSRETLTPKLFRLKNGERIFCGPKVTGHYTAEKAADARNVLLIGSTTGEAANNSIVRELLGSRRAVNICNLTVGPETWGSLYAEEHAAAASAFPGYRWRLLGLDSYEPLERMVSRWCADSASSLEYLGFRLSPEDSHVFLCGDPVMIGAPKKLGAWQYEAPPTALMKALTEQGFSMATRFKGGGIDHEAYW